MNPRVFRANIYREEAYLLRHTLPKMLFWNQTTKRSYISNPFPPISICTVDIVCEPRRRRWNPEILSTSIAIAAMHNDDVDPSIRDPFCVLRSFEHSHDITIQHSQEGYLKADYYSQSGTGRCFVCKCKKGNENLTTGARKRQYKCKTF